MAQAVQGNKRRLVLHFDINNTILMKDASKGLDTQTNVFRIVCKSAWGKLSTKTVTGEEGGDREDHFWTLIHDQLTFTRPENPSMLANIPEGEGDTLSPESIITYQDYIDLVHKRVQREDGTYDPEVEETRLKLQQMFAKPGNPGAKFKNQTEKLLKCLNLPKGAREELGISEDGTMGGDDEETKQQSVDENDEDEDVDPAVKEQQEKEKREKKMHRLLFGEGRYHVIPSFWRTLMYFKKQKKEIAVVFRTFGSELDSVVYEYNLFCNGEHPCFNGRNGTPLVKLDGGKNSKDMRISQPEQRGSLYRAGEQINETFLVTGPHQRVSELAHLNQLDEDENPVIRDHLDVFQTMLETYKKFGSMAISDDFPAWDKGGRKISSAKLLMVDQSDYNTQHIFFDDNADEGEDCIVDVRDVITGQQIENSKFMDMYVVKVHPHRAILESEYFIKEIEKAEQKRDEEIARVEAGIEEEESQTTRMASAMSKEDSTEWEKLQALPDADYLMRTVLPVLYQGISVVDMERPAAPLEFLALHLLKHQDQIKLPPKAFTQKTEQEVE